jgi:hypothetical protein
LSFRQAGLFACFQPVCGRACRIIYLAFHSGPANASPKRQMWKKIIYFFT